MKGNNIIWEWTTIDGEKGFYKTSKSGHVFSIIDITETTITFTNPWDSENKVYTVTWDEFINVIRPQQMESLYFPTPQVPKENEFIINGEVYNIQEIIDSNKATYIHVTSGTQGYANAALDAKIE